MTEAHIYIYGEVYPDNSDFASDWGVVSLKDVVKQFKNTQNPDKIILHINSRGGDVIEGFAIHDFLVNTGIPIEATIEGLCASIATIILLAADDRKMFQNSEFLIHNPWGVAMGDADEMEGYAETLRKFEDRIIDLYIARTKATKKQLEDLMEDEKLLSSDVALELGFINEVIVTVKAVAVIPKSSINKKHNQMEDSIQKETKSILDKILAAITGRAKNTLKIQTADGKVAEFDTDDTEIKIGNSVTVDGKRPLDGDLLLHDKTIIIVKDGKVDQIKKDENTSENKTETEILATIKIVNDAIVAKFGSLDEVITFKAEQKTKNDEFTATLKLISDNLATIAETIHGDFDTPGVHGLRANIDDKELTPVQRALAKKKAEEEEAKNEK